MTELIFHGSYISTTVISVRMPVALTYPFNALLESYNVVFESSISQRQHLNLVIGLSFEAYSEVNPRVLRVDSAMDQTKHCDLFFFLES